MSRRRYSSSTIYILKSYRYQEAVTEQKVDLRQLSGRNHIEYPDPSMYDMCYKSVGGDSWTLSQ